MKENFKKNDSRFKKYFDKNEKRTSKEFTKDYVFGYGDFLKKYWIYSLAILILAFLFYKEIIPFHRGIFLILLSIVGFLLVYFESGFVFNNPQTQLYVLTTGKKFYKLLLYFLMLILFGLGIVFTFVI